MIVLDIPYVRSAARKKGSTYTYKRQVPAEVREALGRKNWIKTWPRGTPVSVVETEARRLAAVHDAEIAGVGMGPIDRHHLPGNICHPPVQVLALTA